MGCDIHSVAQIYKDGEWTTVLKSVVSSRNYHTFALLANVRSGYREPKHYSNQPMSMPRGLPEDFKHNNNQIELPPRTKSCEDYSWYKEDHERINAIERDLDNTEFWMGEHSFSYFSLSEVNEYVQALEKVKIRKYGFLKEKDFLKTTIFDTVPDNHDEFTEDTDLVLEIEDYFLLKKQNKLPAQKYYIKYSWFESIIDGSDLKSIQLELTRVTTEYNVSKNNVRIVFGFDS